MVQPDRGEDTHPRLEHVGGVFRAPKPHLDDPHIDRRVSERRERQRGGHVEVGQRLIGSLVDKLSERGDLPVRGDEPFLTHRLAVHADPLPHRLQVRAGVAPGAQAKRLQQTVDDPGGRGFAVRSRDVDRRVRPVRAAQRVEELLHPPEIENHPGETAAQQLRLDLSEATAVTRHAGSTSLLFLDRPPCGADQVRAARRSPSSHRHLLVHHRPPSRRQGLQRGGDPRQILLGYPQPRPDFLDHLLRRLAQERRVVELCPTLRDLALRCRPVLHQPSPLSGHIDRAAGVQLDGDTPGDRHRRRSREVVPRHVEPRQRPDQLLVGRQPASTNPARRAAPAAPA